MNFSFELKSKLQKVSHLCVLVVMEPDFDNQSYSEKFRVEKKKWSSNFLLQQIPTDINN